jgi:hypothetical protein
MPSTIRKIIPTNLLDTGNSSEALLGIGAVFTGSWVDTLDYGTAIVGVESDVDSATDGLVIEYSTNGVHACQDDKFTITGGIGKVFSVGMSNRYMRVKYTNGGVGQGSFHLQTILKNSPIKNSSHRINDSIVAEDDAELMKSVITGETPAGTFTNVQVTADGNLSISDNSSGLSIAAGDVAGTTFVHKFGNAPDFDTSDGSVVCWDGADDGGINQMQYTYSTTADIDSLSSDNNGDTQDIEVQGLDTNYDLVIQTITLTGQTRKALDTSLIRVFRLKNVGSTNLAGQLYCYVNTALTTGTPNDKTKIRALIDNGNNQTLMALYTIPNGKTGYMRDWYAGVAGASKSSNYVIDVYARPFGQVFQLKHKSAIGDNGTSQTKHKYTEPEVFQAKTDIMMEVSMQAVGGTGAAVSAGFDLVLIDD